MRGVPFIALMALLFLVLSFTLPEPKEVSGLRSAAARIDCAEPECVIALVEMNGFDGAFRGKAESLVLEKGDAFGALALVAATGGEAGAGNLSSSLESVVSSGVSSSRGSDENALIAFELRRRAAADPLNESAAVKAEEAGEFVAARPTDSFTYVYLARMAGWPKARDSSGEPEIRLMKTYSGAFSPEGIAGLFLFPVRAQSELALQAADGLSSSSGAALAGKVYALAHFELERHPGFGWGVFALQFGVILLLPVTLVCIVPLVTWFTVRGRDARSHFQHEMAENVLLCSLLVPVTLILCVQLLRVVTVPPIAGLLQVALPLVAPVFVYSVASVRTQREHGMIKEMRPGEVLHKVKSFFWVAVAGVFVTLIVFMLVLNLKEIRAPLKGPIGEIAVPAMVIILLFAVLPFVPKIAEVASGSREIKDEGVRKRLSALCEKYGCSAESIRFIPSSGSSSTNAMQVGLFTGNVRILLFESLLDPGKFSSRELEAVVAHELAHIKNAHLLKSLVFYVSCYLLILLLLSSPLFFFEKGENVLVDALVAAAPYVGFAATMLATLWLRRQLEFEADAVAGRMGYGRELLSALKKIYRMNLSPEKKPRTLRLFASHGDLRERMRRLHALSSQGE